MKQNSIFSTVFILMYFMSFSQTKISGYVRNSKTKEPLFGASIFAPNTTNGGATDENGFFSFTLNENQNQVIISYIGFESVLVPTASLAKLSNNNVVYLTPLVNNLKEVVVKKISKKDQKQYLELFKNGFIGMGEIALNTKILNPEVLDFDMNFNKTRLLVSADEPIILQNEKTGYQISYELVFFESKVNPNDPNEVLITYFGYPFFKDIILEKKLDSDKIIKIRNKIYKGSTMHFIRSLYSKNCKNEGFSMSKLTKTPNPKYIQDTENKWQLKDFQEAQVMGKKIPKYLVDFSKKESFENDLVFEKDNKKFIYFKDFMAVTYAKLKKGASYSNPLHSDYEYIRHSQICLLENKPIEIYPDGNYSDPDLLGTFGHMGIQKMGEMLPFDFVPDPTITD